MLSGIAKILTGLLALPAGIITGTMHGPPLIGTVFGAVSGAVSGVGLVASGAWDLALGGVAAAKMAAPYVLPFLF